MIDIDQIEQEAAERIKFEAWATKEGFYFDRHKSKPDEYENGAAQDAWQSWLARSKQHAAVRDALLASERLCDELARILWAKEPLKWPEIRALRDDARAKLSRAALAAPVSPPAASRDAVAEVLLREAHPTLAPWTWAQLCADTTAGMVVEIALARRQADAILSRWSAPPAPRGEAVEPVAWIVVGKNGARRSPPYLHHAAAVACMVELDRGEYIEDVIQTPHRVVALVPKEAP